MQTVGLYKLDRLPYSLIVVLVFAEVQQWALEHPYFKEYAIKRVELQKNESKLKAFKLVEKYHLQRRFKQESIKL
jgi:hypothetical protein